MLVEVSFYILTSKLPLKFSGPYVKATRKYSDCKILLSICSIHDFSFISQQIALKIHRIIVLFSIYEPAKFQMDSFRNKKKKLHLYC